MRSFQHKKINLACRTAMVAMFGLSTAFSAVAEESNEIEEDVEVIEVTGVRASLSSALNAKKDSSQITDSIIAEEIGKSSDENIAQALSRISGVSLDRGGEAQTVTVRGMNAALNNVKMNGITMTSNTDDQAVDLSLFSADILSRIDVVKSPSANQEEGSLGASINLKTLAPLARKKNSHMVTAEARYNDIGEEITPRFAYNFVQNLDKEIGFAGSFFYDQVSLRRDEYQIYSNLVRDWKTGEREVGTPNEKGIQTVINYDNDTNSGSDYDVENIIDGQISAVMPRFSVNRVNLDVKTKIGGTTTFQYRPNDDTDIRFDASFSRNEIDHEHSTARLSNLYKTDNIIKVNNYQEIDPNVPKQLSSDVVSAYSHAAAGLNQSGNYINTTDTVVLGAQFEHTINDYWNVSGRIGYALTDQEITDGYRTAWVHTGLADKTDPDSWCGFDTQEGPQGDNFLVNRYCDTFDPADASKLVLQGVRSDRRDVDDNQASAYLDFERFIDDSFITSVEFGTKYTNRSKNVYAEEVALPSSSFIYPGDIRADHQDIRLHNITDNSFLEGIAPDTLINDWLMPNSADAVKLAFDGQVPAFEANPLNAWGIDEITYGAYVQANYEFLDGLIGGNFGVRYAGTKVEGHGSTGTRYNPDLDFLYNKGNEGNELVTSPTTGEFDYGEVLPSVTINWLYSEDLIFRASAARVMARPNINSLRPAVNINAANLDELPRANGGNIDVKPFLADQIDFATEWYFEEGALLSAGIFYKNFVSNSYKITESQVFPNTLTDELIVDRREGANRNEQLAATVATHGAALVDYTHKINGATADILGAEFSYSQNYTFLPGFLSGLGASLNYTYADSEAIVKPDEPEDPFNGLPFLNTSKHSSNNTLFWENKKMSMRLVYSYRSKALSNTAQFNSSIVRDGRETLDFAFNYAITQQLRMTLTVNNLTESYDRFYNIITDPRIANVDSGHVVKESSNDLSDTPEDRVQEIKNSGRNLRLSMRYSF